MAADNKEAGVRPVSSQCFTQLQPAESREVNSSPTQQPTWSAQRHGWAEETPATGLTAITSFLLRSCERGWIIYYPVRRPHCLSLALTLPPQRAGEIYKHISHSVSTFSPLQGVFFAHRETDSSLKRGWIWKVCCTVYIHWLNPVQEPCWIQNGYLSAVAQELVVNLVNR